MKDIVTPVPQEEVKAVIRKCLEQAALVNYQRLSEYAKVEGKLKTQKILYGTMSVNRCVTGKIAETVFLVLMSGVMLYILLYWI